MRIGIIGTGALACLFAAYLHEWADVVMVGSWPEQLRALAQGLTLVDLTGQRRQMLMTATADLAGVPPVDVALVLVKSYQTKTAVARVQSLLSPHGLAVTLQNGLGNLQPLADAVGSTRAAVGVVTMGATLQQPGVVRHAGAGIIYLSPPTPAHDLFPPLVAVLQQAEQDVRVVPDVQGLIWGKLAVNAGINPLTAVFGIPNGQLTVQEPLRRVMEMAAVEVAAVAAAQGIVLPFPDAAAQAFRVAHDTFHNQSSMLQDVRNGRITEIDAICGAVVQYGEQFGVQTPVNRQLLQWVHSLEAGKTLIDWRIQTANEVINLVSDHQ